jgi:hypothetical protein
MAHYAGRRAIHTPPQPQSTSVFGLPLTNGVTLMWWTPRVYGRNRQPKKRTKINFFASFPFDLIPKFACEAASCELVDRDSKTMPILLRLLTIIALLCAVIYGGLYALAHFVQPKSREMSVSIPPDKFFKER